MDTASNLLEDTSNSPNLFCYKESPQTTDSKNVIHNDKPWSAENSDSKSKVSQTKKEKSPKNSLNFNQNHLQDDCTPGPGAYYPEASTMRAVYRTPPSYSFGQRFASHRQFETSRTPGPGSYQVDKNWRKFPDKTREPHYSFGHRHSWSKAPFIIEYK